MSTLSVTNIKHASSASNNIALDSSGNATFAGNLAVPSLNSGPLAGFRNAIINGNFDIWQRGTSFSDPANNTYTADRWVLNYDGSGATRTLSRQAFTLGQTDVPGEPTYFFRFDQSGAGSGATYNVIEQKIESVRTFAGQQVTLSFWAKAAASLTMPIVLVRQQFGTGGSPSSLVDTVLVTNQTITTSWVKYTYTATLPSISGKTLGSDNNDYLSVILLLPVNTTFTFDIAQVQLEVGPVATPFERRPIGTELALCQRYYQQTNNLGYGNAQKRISNSSGSTIGACISFDFPVQMRAVPTLTVVGDINDGSPQTLGAAGASAFVYGFSVFETINNGQFLDYHYHTASAEL